jgi:hypothetical protein
MKKPTAYLSADRAIDVLLHQDGRLMLMKTAAGQEWFVLPRGGRVRPDDIRKIIHRPDIVASEDGLFAGHTQTYRRREPATDGRRPIAMGSMVTRVL